MNTCRVLKLNVPNRNYRVYSEEVIMNSIINDPVIKEQLANNCCFIYEGPETDAKNVIAAVKNIYIEVENDNKYLTIEYEFLDTPKGKICKKLTNAEVEIVTSGFGNLIFKTEGEYIVDDYTFNSFYVAGVKGGE